MFGIGLRGEHHPSFLTQKQSVDFLELHSENYFSGIPREVLRQIAGDYVLSFHGVGLSLGSTDPLSRKHLRDLKSLVDEFNPAFVSEHMSWVSVDGQFHNDLLPLPLTEEALQNLSDHVSETQDFLGRQILVENPSSCLAYKDSTIYEPEFLTRLAEKTQCKILLDVNNIYVNSINHGYDAEAFLAAMPSGKIVYGHIAGHFDEADDLKIDTHGADVIEPVWQLLRKAYEIHGVFPTLLERDFNIPPLNELLQEMEKIRTIQQQVSSMQPKLFSA